MKTVNPLKPFKKTFFSIFCLILINIPNIKKSLSKIETANNTNIAKKKNFQLRWFSKKIQSMKSEKKTLTLLRRSQHMRKSGICDCFKYIIKGIGEILHCHTIGVTLWLFNISIFKFLYIFLVIWLHFPLKKASLCGTVFNAHFCSLLRIVPANSVPFFSAQTYFISFLIHPNWK